KAKGWLYDSGSPRRSARLGLQSKEIIEQVCSSHLGAVLAYDEWGEPIFGPDTKSLHQQVSLRRLRNAARNAVLNILRNYKLMEAIGLMPHLTEPHSYRDAYLGMIAFPSEEEYSLFASWIHEENNLSDNTETLDS